MSESNLDIAFCVDNTGSMSPYIFEVQKNINNIIQQIVKSEKANVRFGLVHYRDHKDEYVVRRHEFSDDMKQIQLNVSLMEAAGGNDGPEAVAAAFKELNQLQWRKFSTKIVVFIADAPPHGIELGGDDYPNGDPQGIDPIEEVKELVIKEALIYSMGCEPAINSFVNARSFMKAISDMTGGKYLSLAQANILSDIIIYGAREEINLDKYATQIEEEVSNVQKANPALSLDNIYATAAANLQAQGICTPQMQVDEVVDKSAFSNASVFSNASNLMEARTNLPVSVPSYGQQMPASRISSVKSAAPAPLPTITTSSTAASSNPHATPQMQQAQMNVSPISIEQVQRLYERKQNVQQSKKS